MFSKLTTKNNIEMMVANKINEGTTINGNVSTATDIRIDGTITGNIISASKVVLGANANIIGNIKCKELTIECKLKGNIEVEENLFFRTTARFEGDVKYKKLIVEEGAQISGSLVNTSVTQKPMPNPTANGQTSENKIQLLG